MLSGCRMIQCYNQKFREIWGDSESIWLYLLPTVRPRPSLSQGWSVWSSLPPLPSSLWFLYSAAAQFPVHLLSVYCVPGIALRYGTIPFRKVWGSMKHCSCYWRRRVAGIKVGGSDPFTNNSVSVRLLHILGWRWKVRWENGVRRDKVLMKDFRMGRWVRAEALDPAKRRFTLILPWLSLNFTKASVSSVGHPRATVLSVRV